MYELRNPRCGSGKRKRLLRTKATEAHAQDAKTYLVSLLYKSAERAHYSSPLFSVTSARSSTSLLSSSALPSANSLVSESATYL